MATVPVKQLYTKKDRKPYFPKTSLKAVFDKNGNDAQNVIDAMQDQIQQQASGAILDGSVTLSKLSDDVRLRVQAISTTPVTTAKTATTSQEAGGTDYITDEAITINAGDKVKLAIGDSLALTDGTAVFTATAGDQEYTATTGVSYYITTPDTTGSVSYESIHNEASFAIADGSITMDKLDEDVQEAIEAAGSADEVTITKSATTGEMSVKDGGISEDKLDAALADKINGKVDAVSGKGLSANDYTDADKTKLGALPDATALQDDLDLKADKASPALTGVPTAPTAAAGTNTQQIATTAFVTSAVEAETTARTSAISAETSARTAADTLLTTNLATEVAAREAAVDNLNAAIASGVGTTAAVIQPTMTATSTSTTDGVSAKGIADFVAEQKAQTQAEIDDLAQQVDELEDEVDALDDKITSMSVGRYYGYYSSSSSLPAATTGMVVGYAYVGASSPFKVYNFDGATWKDSGSSIANVAIVPDGVTIEQGSDGKLKVADSVITTTDDELSETSENPVQNKVVTESLNNLDLLVQTPPHITEYDLTFTSSQWKTIVLPFDFTCPANLKFYSKSCFITDESGTRKLVFNETIEEGGKCFAHTPYAVKYLGETDGSFAYPKTFHLSGTFCSAYHHETYLRSGITIGTYKSISLDAGDNTSEHLFYIAGNGSYYKKTKGSPLEISPYRCIFFDRKLNEADESIGSLYDLKSENVKTTKSEVIGNDTSLVGTLNEIILKSGQYDILGSLELEVGETGKYVNVSDGTTANSAYAISSPVDLVQGNIYFFCPSSDIASPISLFAEYETHTQTVVDGYNIGADGEPDYNDPITHEDIIKTYKSLYNNPTGSRPESGFYIYTCDENKQVVFSAKAADVNGAKVYYTRNGVISSLITQILNDPKAQVLVESIVTALARLDSFDSLVANGFAQLKAGIVDASELRIMGHKNVMSGSGAPSVLPDHIGQMYLDLVAKTTYIAYNTEAVSGWKEL